MSLTLDITPALDGYALALRGDQTFVTLATFPTSDEAMKARKAALAYAAVLDGPDFNIASKEA